MLLAANVSPISWKITLTNNVQSESNISKQFLAVINVCKICTTTPAKTKHYLQLFITSLPNRTVDCFLVFVTSANLTDVKSKVILSMAKCSKVSKFMCLKAGVPMSTTDFVIPVLWISQEFGRFGHFAIAKKYLAKIYGHDYVCHTWSDVPSQAHVQLLVTSWDDQDHGQVLEHGHWSPCHLSWKLVIILFRLDGVDHNWYLNKQQYLTPTITTTVSCYYLLHHGWHGAEH